jgi:hypothetical protein
MEKNKNIKKTKVSKKAALSKNNLSFKSEVNKDVFKNINLKQNIIIILLIALLVLLIFFVTIYTTNMVVKNIFSEEFYEDSIDIKSIEILNIPVDTVNNSHVNSRINDLDLEASELINNYLITTENIDSLKNNFAFLFNDQLVAQYDFLPTEVGDSILEYRDYLLVYNKDLDIKKSVWNIDYIE